MSSELNVNEIKDWQAVLAAFETPQSPLAISVKKHLIMGANAISKASTVLSGADINEIKETLKVLPIDKLASILNEDNFYKYASINDQDSFIKIAKLCQANGIIPNQNINYKTASWWSTVKSLGGGTLKYGIPLISLLFAAKNFYYCAIELSKLLANSSKVDLKWYQALKPEHLMSAATKYSEDPKSLIEIINLNKSSKSFMDEFISFVLNYLDGIKDIIFLIADFVTAGFSVGLDIGISLILMSMEIAIEKSVLPAYDNIFDFIAKTATDKISSLTVTRELPTYGKNLKEHFDKIFGPVTESP